MEIIPALDLIDGKCVRLKQGDYGCKKVYSENPLEIAMAFEDAGLQRLHLVDLDGAKEGRIRNYRILEKLASGTKLIIDFGGGIKTKKDVQDVFNAGAAFISVGSIAVKNTPLFLSWIREFGGEKILLGADVKEEKIMVTGWLEKTEISLFDFIKRNMKEGIGTVLCTDIVMDGSLGGPSVDMYARTVKEFPLLKLVASGGVASLKDIETLKEIGCSGVIIGKAIYEKKITLKELRIYNQKQC